MAYKSTLSRKDLMRLGVQLQQQYPPVTDPPSPRLAVALARLALADDESKAPAVTPVVA